MVAVNILYNATTGRILSASLNPISPIPAGHAIDVKTVTSVVEIFDKQIDPVGLPLVRKDFLRLDSAAEIPVATVTTAGWTKRDGATEEAEDDAGDNEAVSISSRQPDYSFDAAKRKAFFDVLQTELFQGAGQVKVASGLAPGSEILVAFSDTLSPLFRKLAYV
jgi:hypothetical protein